MLTLSGKYRYRAAPFPPSPEEWWPARVYASLSWAIENHAEFPRRLCPDAWKWFRDVPYDRLPLEVTDVPRGSWLAARLTHLAGSEQELAQQMTAVDKPGGGQEFRLELSAVAGDDEDQVGAIALLFDKDHIRIEGFSQPELAREFDDDLMNILCRDALVGIAVCRHILNNEPVGWDGQHFYGELTRPSRFTDIQAEEQRFAELAQRSIELAPGDDTLADSAPMIRQIANFVRSESADQQFIADNLTFLRSARIDDAHYLVWDYYERGGEKCYVTFATRPRGETLGMNLASGLSPEQYIYADYHEWF